MRLPASTETWREQYNPLRGLTLAHAVALLEAGERGETAALQWLYRAIEKRNPTLRAVRHRRLDALGQLDWSVKCAPGGPPEAAERQQAVLRAAYDRVANLRDVIAHLAGATFRGYAHVQIERGVDGRIAALTPVPQWHLFRAGRNAPWQFNAEARDGAPRETDPVLDPADFLIREVDDPVNEIGLIAHLRQSLSQKDWDGFVETYGIPPLFLELPENIPVDREAVFQQQAEAIIGDARGTMPHGTRLHALETGQRGTPPFERHLRYQDEAIVLAGTGGKLTMLAQSGSGTLAGGAHSDTFHQLARAEALAISELLQRQFDAQVLADHFPGQPALAYFELSPAEHSDPGAVIAQVETLAKAGYRVSAEELAERTGFTSLRDMDKASKNSA